MNILPHKSWHVRTKKNIERVRIDEEKAAEEEKEKQRRIALAEQEARTDLLRVRSRNKAVTDGASRDAVTDSSQLSVSEDKQKLSVSQDLFPINFGGSEVTVPGLGDRREHINFFKDIEDGTVKQGKNKEREEEKKKEQEELEKKIGLLTYLGQSSLGGQESAPWYLQKSKKQNKQKDESNLEDDEDREKKLKLAMEEKRKQFLDPLMLMKDFVDKKERKHGKKKHKDMERKNKLIDKSRSTSSSSKATPSSVSSKKTIEQLRAERLARERQENKRTQALLTQGAKETAGTKRKARDSSSDDEKVEAPGAKRKYNSQYNPEFVRQPKSRHRENFH